MLNDVFLIRNALIWLNFCAGVKIIKLLGFILGLDLSKLKSKEKRGRTAGGCLLQFNSRMKLTCVLMININLHGGLRLY